MEAKIEMAKYAFFFSTPSRGVMILSACYGLNLLKAKL